MDPSLRLASLTAFYFGARIAAAAPTNPVIIDTVSQRAYRDLNRTLHGIGTHPDKATLLDTTHQSLHQFTADLDTVNSQDEFDALHDKWCQDRIGFFATYPRADREFTFTYGQAQKWLNMTMKYLAVLDHPSVQRVYPYLHVPIDTIIYNQADQIGVPRPPKRRSWSRLDRDHYMTYHDQLREQITARTDCSAPLDWEAHSWITRTTQPKS